jgi:hypothetical protein
LEGLLLGIPRIADLVLIMKPVFFCQAVEKLNHQVYRAMLLGSFNVLGQTKHFLHRRCIVPRSQD